MNSPRAVYQIEPDTLVMLRTFGTSQWHEKLATYLAERETLVARYAKEREQNRIPVEDDESLDLSLIRPTTLQFREMQGRCPESLRQPGMIKSNAVFLTRCF